MDVGSTKGVVEDRCTLLSGPQPFRDPVYTKYIWRPYAPRPALERLQLPQE